MQPIDSSPVQFSLSKTASPSQVTPGGTFFYTLTILNTGSTPINPAPIIDALPPYVSLNGAPSIDTGTIVNYGTNQNLNLYLTGSIGSGKSLTITIPVIVASDAPPGPLQSNTLSVTGSSTNNQSTLTDTVTETNPPLVISSPILSVSKSASTYLTYPTGSFLYQLTITNTGSSPTASPFLITDNLPQNTFLSAPPSSPLGPISNTGSATNLALELTGSLNPGQSTTVSIPVTVSP